MRSALSLAVVSISIGLAGCGGGEDVTPQALRQAEHTWRKAHIQDYNLEWIASGPTMAHYRVFVREGQVRAIYSLLADGREIEVHSGQPQMFGVEGLFQTLEEERAQLDSPSPFGRPKGTDAILRFTPDPKLGYPRSYRRDVLGTPKALAIDVIRLDPNPPPKVPPPSS